MPAPALNAGATRLVSHVPGAATTQTTRGGASRETTTHPQSSTRVRAGPARARGDRLERRGARGREGHLHSINTATRLVHHNPPTHARCRLAHQASSCRPRRSGTSRVSTRAISPRASAASAAAAAASAATASPQDRGRFVVTRASAANGAKEVGDDATSFEARARSSDPGALDRRALDREVWRCRFPRVRRQGGLVRRGRVRRRRPRVCGRAHPHVGHADAPEVEPGDDVRGARRRCPFFS